MAEEEEPSRPFMVMGDIVVDYSLVGSEEGWEMLDCRRCEAYDCGDYGDLIVKGLTLFVRDGPEDNPDLCPSMSISATTDVLSCIGLMIDEDMADIFGRQIRLAAHVYTVSGDVMVLSISFLARHDAADFRSYYLVYDSTAAALFLLPRGPRNCQPICTTFPLKVGEDKYTLVLMAERSIVSTFKCTQAVLLMWSPPLQSSGKGKKIDNTHGGWTVKGRARENAESFRASVVFLWKGNALWGDLGRGILYCDCSELIDGTGLVDFKCIMLPSECMDTDSMNQVPKHVYRNMGCVGDSIWFVIIEASYASPGQTTVKVWILDLQSEEMWKPHREFTMDAIWGLDDLEGKGLPHSVPKYPMFRQQDDGVLYMLLPDDSIGDDAYAYLVGIDLSSEAMRLAVHRRLSVPWMDRFFFMDPDLFRHRMAV